MDPDSSHLYILLLISLSFSGFISAYEASLSDLSSVRLEKRAEDGDKRSAFLLKLIHDPHQTLLTLMICDWFADVSFLVLFTYLGLQYKSGQAFLLPIIALATPLLIIFGEVLPKSIASKMGEKLSYQWLPALRVLLWGFHWPVKILSLITRPFLGVVGARLGQMVPDYTEEEILKMVNLSGHTGILDKEESELVQSAFNFDDTSASTVLTPRVDMLCIEHSTTVDEALDIMASEEGFSRLPVYRENLDQIIGLVYIKDLLKIRHYHPETGNDPVEMHLRKAHHIHEFRPINEVLKEMKARRMSIFIVTDEYGGTVGLITMEDLLEEIVGEIHDEYDIDEAPLLTEIDSNTFLVDGKVSVSDINEMLDLDLPDAQSVSGLVFNALGEAPQAGQSIDLDGARFTVETLDGIRIVQVRVHKLQPDEDLAAI